MLTLNLAQPAIMVTLDGSSSTINKFYMLPTNIVRLLYCYIYFVISKDYNLYFP